ncbi:MAG: GNAT family N-acetyltransferase [Gordonia sp. (in: high G+C Gram-positive bacteria)]
MPIELAIPHAALHESWLDARDEWGGAGSHQPGSGIWLADAAGLCLDHAGDFARWVEALNRMPFASTADGAIPATTWWILRNDRYLGSIQLRHILNDDLAELGGHIGYGIRPTERRKHIASRALREVLDYASAQLGLQQVLVTCDDSNIASQRTALAAGGTLRKIRAPDAYARERGRHEPIHHYWLPTATRSV